MANEKIIVLDNDAGDIKMFNYKNEFAEDIEDFLYEQERLGLMGRVSNCYWMATMDAIVKFI